MKKNDIGALNKLETIFVCNTFEPFIPATAIPYWFARVTSAWQKEKVANRPRYMPK